MLKGLKDLLRERKNKKKKGFTLVELLAVIVILAVIMVITIPTVLGNISKSKEKAFETVGETMRKYLVDNYNNCRLGNIDIAKYDDELFKTDGSCQLKNNISDILITNSGYSTDDIDKVEVTEDGRGNFGVNILTKDDGQFDGMVDNSINSVPNAPDLSTGLVPIKYNGENWVVTTSTDPEWFDYNNQKWANAASLVEGVSKEPGTELRVPNGDEMTVEDSSETDILAMFVWVPRFSYTIGCLNSDTECYGYRMNDDSDKDSGTPSQSLPGAIDIKFVSKATKDVNYTGDSPTYTYTSESDRTPINWYTHPAFTFGDDELSGIWVGKFETSVNPDSTCYSNLSSKSSSNAKTNCVASKDDVTPRILPNVLSLVYQNVYNEFETAKKFTSNTMYGLTTKTDSHMMKNSEWGAVAYLSQSIYGKYGNQNYEGTNKEIYKNDSGDSWARYTGRSQGTVPATYDYSEQGTYKYDDISTTAGTKEAHSGTGASTTGNIYGIYDISGGAFENVMGYYTEASSVFGGYTSSSGTESNNSGFTNEIKPDNKYFDGYKGTIEGETKSIDLFTKSNEVIGHATAETKRWYSDSAINIHAYRPWILRGGYFLNGSDAGAFYSNRVSGSALYNYSFRSVLATIES